MEETSLESIEEQLTRAVRSDKGVWQHCYELMHEVEEKELYKEKGWKNFTGWMNGMAQEIGCHVSLLWARLKAGRTYEEYARRAEAAGRSVPRLADVNVSPDAIKLCSTVAGSNAQAMDHLMEKAISGDLSREDLRAAARAKKAKNPDAPAETRHSAAADEAARAGQDKQPAPKPELTAAQIVLALKQPHTWIGKPNSRKYIDRKCRFFTEFRCDTGSSKAARRFDVLVAETLTASERDTVVLHGVEIKVSLSDLHEDHKMAEYTAFCDYFYIAVPADQKMIKAAESVKLPDWGVLSISQSGIVTVVDPAKSAPGPMRDKTVAAVAIKLM